MGIYISKYRGICVKSKKSLLADFSGLFQCLNEASFGTILEKSKADFY